MNEYRKLMESLDRINEDEQEAEIQKIKLQIDNEFLKKTGKTLSNTGLHVSKNVRFSPQPAPGKYVDEIVISIGEYGKTPISTFKVKNGLFNVKGVINRLISKGY